MWSLWKQRNRMKILWNGNYAVDSMGEVLQQKQSATDNSNQQQQHILVAADEFRQLEILPNLREYQKFFYLKILENDKEGFNSLVVLPTGAGKTRIASAVIQHFLQRADKIETVVVFLAPTVQLVEQQRRVIAADLDLAEAGDINTIHSGTARCKNYNKTIKRN